MVHFMAQLTAYSQLEGIELAWQDLIKYTHAREGDLDTLIGTHRAYLKQVEVRALLLTHQEENEVSSKSLSDS